MASFNQSPLGQLSRAMVTLTANVGSAAHLATTRTNLTQFSSNGNVAAIGVSMNKIFAAIYPLWRRTFKSTASTG